MQNKRSLAQKITEAANLMDEPIPGLSLVEIAGDRRVLIENHCGVVEYGSRTIRVKVKFGQICVCGCNLNLARMTKGHLIISGRVDAVQLLRGTKP